MKKFKVGVQLYSVREDLAKDFEGTLQAIKDMGYDYVEFAGFYDKSAEEVKSALDKIGLTAVSVHQGNQLFLEQGQAAIDYLKTVGVKYCAIPWHDKSKLAGTDAWENTKKEFADYSKALKAAGIKLLYHNHDFEFEKADGKYKIDYIYDEIGLDTIEPEFDTCWVKYAGEDPCKYIEKYSGHVEVLHLKDFVCKNYGGAVYALIDKNGKEQKPSSMEENGFKFMPVGSGVQDFKSILEAAEKAGTEYIIVEQDASEDRPPMEAVKMSRDYLRTLGQ